VDNDTVFLGYAFRNLLNEFNMSVEITAPYAHWQHGRIERQWGALVPMALSYGNWKLFTAKPAKWTGCYLSAVYRSAM
jgi:hypothetical protein